MNVLQHPLKMASRPAWLSSDFQSLHEGLIAVAELQPVSTPALDDILQEYQKDLTKLLDHPPKNNASREKVNSGKDLSILVQQFSYAYMLIFGLGKINIHDEEYEINKELVEDTVQLA